MDIKENIIKLFNLGISNYKISKETGIAQTTLGRFTTGESELGNMTLNNALKLNDYYNKIKGEIKMNLFELLPVELEEILNTEEMTYEYYTNNVRGTGKNVINAESIHDLKVFLNDREISDDEILERVNNHYAPIQIYSIIDGPLKVRYIAVF